MKLLPLVLTLLLCGTARAATIPELKGRVNDAAGTMTQDQRDRIEAKLAAHEAKSTDQVVILTVKSLEGLTREQYAQKVFDAWRLGTKKDDNGVLILQSTGDRKLHILTGRGMEGRLPDGKCGEIRDRMTPLFKAGKFYEGYDLGVTAILAAADAEPTRPTTAPAGAGISGGAVVGWVGVVAGIGVLIAVGAGLVAALRRKRERAELPRPACPPRPTLSRPDYGSYVAPPSPPAARSSSSSSSSSRPSRSSGSDSSSSSSSSSYFSSSGGSDSGGSGGYSGGGGCSDGGGAGGDY